MLPDIREQQVMFDELMRDNLSVRELRNRIASRRSVSLVMSDVKTADPETSSLEEKLREVLGTRVKLQKEGEGGRLTINFYSKEELDAIISKLIKSKEELENNGNFIQAENTVQPEKPEEFIV